MNIYLPKTNIYELSASKFIECIPKIQGEFYECMRNVNKEQKHIYTPNPRPLPFLRLPLNKQPCTMHPIYVFGPWRLYGHNLSTKITAS